MPEFIALRNRDAWFVIRGFKYQIDLTILRWIQLGGEQVLELEAGEDIDTVARIVEGREEEPPRLLEQVKHLQKSITLRSSTALMALANALEHKQANPHSAIVFRLVTNTPYGTERPSPFNDRRPAIEIWEGIRNKAFDPGEVPRRLAGIRDLLLNARKPADFNVNTWAALTQFLGQASDADLQEFIGQFEWSTGGTPSERVSDTVIQALVEQSVCRDAALAKDLYSRLFLHVVDLLTHPGRKQLGRERLLEEARFPALSSTQAARLELITARIMDLEDRVHDLELYSQRSEQAISAIVTTVGRVLPNVVTAQFYPSGVDVDILPPMKPRARCERRKTVDGLLANTKATTWLSIHGGVGCGKTQLCLLLVERSGAPIIWIRLRDLEPQEAAVCIVTSLAQVAPCFDTGLSDQTLAQVIARIPEGTLIVLDDVPEMPSGSSLSELFLQLVAGGRTRKVRLISSSHHAIPRVTIDRYSEGTIQDIVCPRFSDEEAMELFRAQGAPEEFLASRDAASLNSMASGHPAILLAVSRFISSVGWRIDKGARAALQRHKHESEVIEETVRRLLTTVEDETARGLLYRMSLILGRFTFQEVKTVSDVVPEILQPRERLSRLSGLWVEQETRDTMTVSPLVKPLADSEIEIPLKNAVQEALADQILRSGRLSVLDVAKGVHYLVNAGAFSKAGTLLALALTWRRRMPKDQLAFILSLGWLHQPLPTSMDLGLRIFLRAHQIAALCAVGLPLGHVLSDARSLLIAADDDCAWAVFAFGVVALHDVARTDFGYAAQTMLSAVRAFPKARVGTKKLVLPKGSGPEDLAWFIIGEIRTPEDFLVWIQCVAAFPPEVIARVFSGSMGEHSCQIAVDRVWMAEHERQNGSRDWKRVVESYDKALSLGDVLPPLFRVMVARARIIVLAEYLDDLGGAVRIASDLLADSSIDASGAFLLNDIVGCQFIYKKRYEEGLPWLRAALAAKTDSFPWIRFRTLLQASRAVGDVDRAGATKLAEEAVDIVQRNPHDVGEQQTVVALGELAIARWLQGAMPGSFAAYDIASEILLRVEDESADWKQLFVFLGTIGGYLSSIAATGQPPEKTSGGEPYAIPFRGMLLGINPKAAEFYDKQRVGLFHPMLAMFAEAVGNDDRAAYWASRGIESARKAGMLVAISSLGMALFPLLLRNREFLPAIDVALEFCTALRASMERQRQGLPLMQMDLQASEVLGSKPTEAWNGAERDVVIQTLPAVMTKLGEIVLAEGAASESALEIARYCERLATTASDPGLWDRVAMVFRFTFVEPKPFRELHEILGRYGKEGYEPVRALGYLGESLLPDAPLEVCLICQAQAVYYWSHLSGHKSGIYRQGILDFLVKYWSRITTEQPFRFTPPQLARESLANAAKLPEDHRAQAIFRSILAGIGRRLPDALDQVSTWIKDA